METQRWSRVQVCLHVFPCFEMWTCKYIYCTENMSIKPDFYHFLCCCLMYELQTCQKRLHTLDYFTIFIMVSSLGLLLHQQSSTGFFASCAKVPQMKTKVAEGKRNMCLCGWFKGSGKQEGSLFKGITYIQEESLWVLKLFWCFLAILTCQMKDLYFQILLILIHAIQRSSWQAQFGNHQLLPEHN